MKKIDDLIEVPAVRAEFRDSYTGGPEPHCFVYEVWDTSNRLAYVGIADNFERRWRQHVAASWWLGEIEIDHINICGYRSRWEARLIEAVVINEQHPVFNTARETGSYAAYNELSADRLGEWDLRPVAKRKFIPRGWAS